MGKGLRTNLSAKTKSKYKGKDKLYHDLQSKDLNRKPKTNFVNMYPHLLEIDISGCDMIGDESIVNFVSVFRHLQVLKVISNANITDNSLKSIARDLKDLHQLDICFCPKISNAGLFTVAKYCKNCKQIYVGDHQFPNQLVEVVENMSVR